jgi:hypothetical protein
MHLKYRVEKSDLTAFARYHYQHSPAMKNRVTVWRWASALSGLIIIAGLGYLLQWELYYFLAPFVGLFIYFYMPKSIFKRLEKDILKFYGEGSNKALFGEHELYLHENNLEAKSQYANSVIEFSGIERLGETADHTFIYLNALTAAPISRHAILEGDYDVFIKALKSRLKTEQKLN